MSDPMDLNRRRAALRAVLASVRLPDGRSLADSGRLGAMTEPAPGRVSFSIRVTAEEAEAFEPVRLAAEKAAERLPGVQKALVMLTAERTEAPKPAAAPPQLKPAKAPAKVLEGVKAVIAVASGKGGVGKSTTTVSLALALRHLGLKVGVLDADIYGPSVPTLLGLTAKPQLAADGRRLKPLEAWGLQALSVGNLVDPDTAMIWRGPMIQSAITQLIAEVDWGRLDVLLIDMPPGTGDAQLAVAQQSPLTGAVIVSTPQDLALIDARRGIAMFRKLEVPVLGVIENMSQFICPDCGGRHEIFGHGGAREEARRIGVPFLGEVPLTMALRRGADLGRPIVATEPESQVGQSLIAIAGELRLALRDKGLI
ncbi:P-loop NTPase [Falsigemmobacter intermedius]|uniref:Mrp/NBP35 family ATP-binding protein n=1 Tax=Falsigemmobacter intermedius TaxID=1553448 RepID=UPI003F06853F